MLHDARVDALLDDIGVGVVCTPWKIIIIKMGGEPFYSRFETCFAPSIGRCLGAKHISNQKIGSHHFEKGSDVIICDLII